MPEELKTAETNEEEVNSSVDGTLPPTNKKPRRKKTR